MAVEFRDYKCKEGSDLGGFDDNIVEKVNMEFPSAYTHNEGIARISRVIKEENKREFCLLPFCHTVEAENYGADINLGSAKIGSRCGSHIYKDSMDLKELPDLDFNKGRLAEVLQAIEILKKNGEVVCVNTTGPITTLNNLIDIGKLIKVWRKEPEVINKVVEKIRLQLLLYFEKLCEAGTDIIAFEDPVGGLNILGPKYFEILGKGFTYPFVKGALEVINKRSLLHLCPKLSFQLIDLGFAQWEEINLEKPLSYEKAYIKLKGKIAMVGSICIHNRDVELKNKKIRVLNLI